MKTKAKNKAILKPVETKAEETPETHEDSFARLMRDTYETIRRLELAIKGANVTSDKS